MINKLDRGLTEHYRTQDERPDDIRRSQSLFNVGDLLTDSFNYRLDHSIIDLALVLSVYHTSNKDPFMTLLIWSEDGVIAHENWRANTDVAWLKV